MGRVLLVDDEIGMLYALKEFARAQGHDVVLAQSGQEALARLDGVDVVIADYSMPEMDGLALTQFIRERDPSVPVIMVTAHGSERIAVQAMKAGAYEYVTKPFDVDELSVLVDRALETRSLRVENRRLAAEKAIGHAIVGDGPAMKRLLEVVSRVAPRDITVLVKGETGTGKELVASLIHAQSARSSRPLVRFNCAAIPGELAEAELFGHTRGAFTGATQARRGFFAQADGGTLILDEVGELPTALQPKVLRALQEGEIQPVGAGRVERVDVRVVACTNRDLEAEVRQGRFRQDLYYRLAVVDIVVPPLREHREDIPAMVEAFARRYGERFGVGQVRISPELMDLLRSADWPGNVRQLENAIARMVAMSSTGSLGPEAFAARQASSSPDAPEAALPLREYLDAIERNLVARAITDSGGNQSEAARRLGLSRGALIERLKKYGLD